LEIDVTVAGGQYSCISTYANSNVNTIVANIIFNSTDTTSAVDLLFVVKYVTAPLGNCIQVGGSVERCSNLYAWPTEWNQDAVNGQLYTATIDVSASEYYWPEGQYQFCFGNSEPTSGYDNFLGTVAVQDLISEPAVFEVSSAVGETLAVSLCFPLIHPALLLAVASHFRCDHRLISALTSEPQTTLALTLMPQERST
jgi:hypothetical protein